jgi:molybdate transport system substrate-binding protein
MNRHFLAVLMLALAALPQAAQAQVKVITSGGFATPLAKIVPVFEKATGISVTVTRGASQGAGPNTIAAQLGRGVRADLVIMSREGLNDLMGLGRIVAGSDIDLAKTPIGLAVRAGAAKPDIATDAAFRKTLLAAKSITFPASTTGIYMTKEMFPKLGIAREVLAKSSNLGVAAVAQGRADIAIQPVSELMNQPGTQFAGAIPADLQYISVFSTALVKGSDHAADAKRLMDFLASAKAHDAMRDSGMEPATRH